jgi:hypothetical protein
VQTSPADQATGKGEQGLVEVGSVLPADRQPTVLVQPGDRALDHPPPAAQPRPVFDAVLGDHRPNAHASKGLAVRGRIVAAVSNQPLRAPPRPTGPATHGWNLLD